MEWNLKTYGGAIYDGYLWFSNNTFNGLFRLSLSSGDIELVDFFPNEKKDIIAAHKKCIYHNGALFFFPAHANNIHIYIIADQKFRVIPINRGGREYCADAILVDDKIYVFTLYANQCVWILNTHDFSLCEISSIKTKYNQIFGNDEERIILCRCSEYNGKIYFAIYGTDMVASFDIKAEKLMVFHTGVEDIFSCYVDNGKCWMITCHTGNVYCYDFISKPVLMHRDDNVKYECRKYNQIINYADKIWIIPAYPGSIICFDSVDSKTIYNNFSKENPKYILFFGIVQVKDEMWLLPFQLDYIYALNENKRFKRKYSCIFQDEKKKGEILAGLLEDKQNILYEHEHFNLSDFLKAVNYMKIP